jgi:hypothetical protein
MKLWEPKYPGTLWGTRGLLLDDFTSELKIFLFYKPYKFRTEIFRGMFIYISFKFSSGCPFVGSPCGAVFGELKKPFV